MKPEFADEGCGLETLHLPQDRSNISNFVLIDEERLRVTKVTEWRAKLFLKHSGKEARGVMEIFPLLIGKRGQVLTEKTTHFGGEELSLVLSFFLLYLL